MPYVNGWFLLELPSAERKARAEELVRLMAKKQVEVCGMCCQSSLYDRVMTLEELTMLRESFRDDRNPGVVTMSQLFHCWLTGEEDGKPRSQTPPVAAPDVRGERGTAAGSRRRQTHPCD